MPIATGMAFANKLKKNKKIYVLISDGECQEGTTWESLLIAAKHKLNNLFIIVDYNTLSSIKPFKRWLTIRKLRKNKVI